MPDRQIKSSLASMFDQTPATPSTGQQLYLTCVHFYLGVIKSSGTTKLTISLHSIFTRDLSVLSDLVEESRRLYTETSEKSIIVYTSNNVRLHLFQARRSVHLSLSQHWGPMRIWSDVKRKTQRPLASLVLEPGVLDMLLVDAREFFATADWYRESGIPHHRGYLLHGPPGTGKSMYLAKPSLSL